jgi:hypothetical protein
LHQLEVEGRAVQPTGWGEQVADSRARESRNLIIEEVARHIYCVCIPACSLIASSVAHT